MRKYTIAIVLALSLGGCASLGLQDPWASGKFDISVWNADLTQIKTAAKSSADVVLSTMDALCPGIPQASTVVNDPAYSAAAASVFGVNGSTKALNNINDGLSLLADACNTRNADSARTAIVLGAQAINDAKRIFAAKK